MSEEKKTKTPRKANAWVTCAINAAKKNSLSSLSYDDLEQMVSDCEELIKLSNVEMDKKLDSKEKELEDQLKQLKDRKSKRSKS